MSEVDRKEAPYSSNENVSNILVVGNGFDLYHGMKTSYNAFIEFIKAAIEDESILQHDDVPTVVQEKLKTAGNNDFIDYFIAYTDSIDSWVDLEQLIKEIIDLLTHYLNRAIESYKEKGLSSGWHREVKEYTSTDNPNNLLIFTHFKKLFTDKGGGLQIRDEYSDFLYGIDKNKVVDTVRKEFDDVRIYLTYYLKYYEPYRREDDNNYQQKSIIRNLNPSLIISFNYTDTYKLYEVQQDDVISIHGNIAKENIVLGYNDESERDLDFVYFKKYFQRIKYASDQIDYNMFKDEYRPDNYGSVQVTKSKEIYFFGHSLDITDKEILVPLFQLKNKKYIFYLDETDYEHKVINLIKLLGRDSAVNSIHNKSIELIPIGNG